MRINATLLSSLLLAASASAWVSAPVSVGKQQRYSFGIYSTEAKVSSSTSAKAALLPEFEQALNQAKKMLSSAVPQQESTTTSGMVPLLVHFMEEYTAAGQAAFLAGETEHCSPEAVTARILNGIQYGLQFGMGDDRFLFDVSHQALRGNPETEDGNTVDYYAFGCDFFRYCMDIANSPVLGQDNLEKVSKQLQSGENVVFLANHQSEADPQVVSVCLEKAGYHKEAEDMIYVAGHKVTTDPLAIPFSMGRNLICIHSKKHINTDPDKKKVKQRQNLQAMSAMLKQLKAGGSLLWVAPSGGRDRRDVETGTVPIAPFDSKTIDMFRLMGNKSGVPTHFYSLAMVSYDLCPPPDHVEAGVGEQRNVRYGPVGIALSEELKSEGGLEKRREFCDNAMAAAQKGYDALLEAME